MSPPSFRDIRRSLARSLPLSTPCIVFSIRPPIETPRASGGGWWGGGEGVSRGRRKLSDCQEPPSGKERGRRRRRRGGEKRPRPSRPSSPVSPARDIARGHSPLLYYTILSSTLLRPALGRTVSDGCCARRAESPPGGATAVINCVGRLPVKRRQRFRRIEEQLRKTKVS